MTLILDKVELSLLILHMNVMRNNIKKGFKSNYGRIEGKRMIKVFDDIKDCFNSEFTGEERELYEFNFETDEIDMLHSFIAWYVQEIKLSAEIQGADIEKDEQVVVLDKLNIKIKEMVETTT
ncbi:hypothetical protein KDN24_05590 [Bacillus sp. Bva_UNVM-123]|uniref:hypothetical protein n=1 Tax=Bacillus sp. Bva_UNVM-123 TaxID=2829798 RepID=UPI00391F330F